MRKGGRRRAAAVAVASGWLAATACSALVDRADSQCSTDADCAKFGPLVCAQGGCVPQAHVAEAGGDVVHLGPCSSTRDCLAQHDGANWVCRRADSTCVSLFSPDCTTVLGQYTSDDALVLGALLPIDGPHASVGAALANALRLGINDFATAIPAGRPLALVVCNESTDVDRAARHLRDDLLVPAIVGTGDGATTLAVAHDVTVPGGLFLISPRATANLSSASGSGLVWRTCPSDALEGGAMVAVTEQVVLPALHLATARVALVHATDVTSTEVDAEILGTLRINGALARDPANAASFVHTDYGDPDDLTSVDPAAGYARAIDAVTAPASPADVILLVGSTQAASHVLAGIEQRWPPGAPLARYVVSSGLQAAELLALTAANDALRSRILGVAPGESGPNVDAFAARYAKTFAVDIAPPVFGAAQAYDALFLLALAARTTTSATLLGTDFAVGLRAVVSPRDGTAPAAIDVGPDAIPGALAALSSGEALALNGASAPLGFGATGDVVTDIQVWCIVHGSGAGPLVFQRSGLAYAAGAAALQGTLGNGCLP